MRHSGSWMTIWDDRILEIIREQGPSSPKTIEETDLVHVSKQHISRRLSKLADHGLLRRLPNGVYAMADEGEAYLDGEYDAEAEEYIGDMEQNGPSASPEEVNGQ